MSVVLCLPAHLCVSTAASRGQAPHGNASLGAGGQGREEGRADGMRAGGRRGLAEAEEGEEGM